MNRALVYKEAQFYTLAVSVLLTTFALAVTYYPTGAGLEGEIPRPLAFIPLCLYGVCVFIQSQDTADQRATPTRRRPSTRGASGSGSSPVSQ